MRVASRLFRIQEGEGRLAGLVVGLMFVSMAGFTIGQSGVDALFFDRVGAQALPVMYLLQGGVTLVAMLVLAGTLGRLDRRRAYLATPICLAVVVIGERAALVAGSGWVYRLLWITASLAIYLGGITLWGTAGAVVDTRQAKRLFPIFGAGGILGTVVGGLLTRSLASVIGTSNLLLVWAGALVGMYLLTRLVLGPAPSATRRRLHTGASPLRDLAGAFAFVRRSRLLGWMTLAAVLFSVLFYLLYLPFARASAERFPDPAELAGFFGLFWAAVTGAALFVSMLATNRLFVWVGVAAMVIALPVLYTTAFGVMLVETGFVTLVALRFFVLMWLQGVSSPGWETLVNVVPEGRRDQIRAFLNGGPTQIGTVIAGILALIGQNALTSSQFASIGLGVGVITIVAAVGIRRSYTQALVEALRAGRPQVFEGSAVRQAPITLRIDAESARVLARALRSSDVHERRLAFQLSADIPKEARPLEVADGVEDEDPLVRLATIRVLDASMSGVRERLLPMVDDADPTVAAAAASRSLAMGGNGRASSRIRALLGQDDERVRRVTLEQLSLAPGDRAAELASEALADRAAEVRAAALDVLAATEPERAVDRALIDLRDPDPAVRLAAGRALGAAGGRFVTQVLDALVDRGTADAGVEAVRRMRLDGGGDADIARTFIRSAADRARHERDLAAVIPREDSAAGLLRDAVLEGARSIARAGLWAATLFEPRREDMAIAIENLDGPASQVATALETLEAAGDAALVRPLLAPWEPVTRPPSGNDWLSAALADEDGFVRRCAELVRAQREGGTVRGSATTLTVIERVLLLRNVPLFADLSPADLERLAEHVEERGYADGDVLASEAEVGEEMFIVVDGGVRVVQDRDGTEFEVARRTVGDVVGEMSLITNTPRVASVVAEGAVRTIRLGRREFESMLRERPKIGMGVMQVLAYRLAEATRRHGTAEQAL